MRFLIFLPFVLSACTQIEQTGRVFGDSINRTIDDVFYDPYAYDNTEFSYGKAADYNHLSNHDYCHRLPNCLDESFEATGLSVSQQEGIYCRDHLDDLYEFHK